MTKKSEYVISRRGFVGGVVGLVGGVITVVVGLPVIGYFVSPAFTKSSEEEWIVLGPASSVQPGVPTPFTFSQIKKVGWKIERINRTVYAVTEDNQVYNVFSDACTHLSCKVHWEEERQAFVCPCHDGVFDIEGQVVAGPPPKPLYEYENKVEGDQLMILVEA
ncbi:MAG: Rieske 2Fe-2S domain-containing protein [Anaerolineae bacterium]